MRDFPFARPDALSVPHEYAELLERCPVSHIRLPSGDAAVLLTRYEDVRQVLTDARFSRNILRPEAARLSTTATSMVELKPIGDVRDPPTHTRVRRLLGRAFSPRRVEDLRPSIERTVDELVDAMLAAGPPADAVQALAQPLPARIICKLFGVPQPVGAKFTRWADGMFSLSRYTAEEMASNQQEFGEYVWKLIEAKRAEPSDDFFSDLVAVTDAEDGTLSAIELMVIAQAILVGGVDTTMVMLTRMIGVLLADRAQYERLVADPSLIDSAVEEILRYAPPTPIGTVLVATEDVRVGGSPLPKGTTVIASTGAANHDPRIFNRPDEIVLDRSRNRHLGFGHGANYCLGASLARAEMQTLLRALLRGAPTLELAVSVDELAVQAGGMTDGLEALPVRW